MASTKNNGVCVEGPGGLPVVAINGLNTNKASFLGSTLEVVGAATFDSSATVSGAVSGTTLTTAGTVTALNATAIAGTGTQAVAFTTVANFGIYMGTGIPTVTAATGSLYVNYGGTGVASRLYVNSGTTNWVAVTTVT